MPDKTVQAKETFPVVPTAHWWELRRKFQKSIPGVVTAQYLAAVLGMQESSARANVLTGLKLAGIVDKDGKPTSLAAKWRDDEEYASVCQKILESAYPVELHEAFPDPADNRAGVRRWFAARTKGGENAVEKYVKFYLLLSEADASKASDKPNKVTAKADQPKKQAAKKFTPPPPPSKDHEPTPPPLPPKQPKSEGPAVHINLQVHISADASADQIEQVFASMAKHIYPRAAE